MGNYKEVEMPDKALLLVTNNEQIREAVYSALQEDFVSITLCEDPNQAVEMFERGQFDLVIIDDGGMLDGIWVARALYEIQRDQKIILITDNSSQMNIANNSNLPVQRKPFNSTMFKKRVQEILE